MDINKKKERMKTAVGILSVLVVSLGALRTLFINEIQALFRGVSPDTINCLTLIPIIGLLAREIVFFVKARRL